MSLSQIVFTNREVLTKLVFLCASVRIEMGKHLTNQGSGDHTVRLSTPVVVFSSGWRASLFTTCILNIGFLSDSSLVAFCRVQLVTDDQKLKYI